MKSSGKDRGLSAMRRQVGSVALPLLVVLVLGLVTTQSAQARTFTVLHNFARSDGGYPYASLVRDASGTLYGTTQIGGSGDCGGLGCGVVFKLDTAGTESVLYVFTGVSSDGEYPYDSLFRDKAGNLYGTTSGGGAAGYGTVFKVDTAGTETVLYSFAGGTTDGCYPYGGLIADKSGSLYGTTVSCGGSGAGTVFKLDTSGTETVLHSFAGGSSDGTYPEFTNLLMDKKGNLYGVTYTGGSSNEGVLYKLSRSGTLTVLHSFAGGTTDGCNPYGIPAMDKKGNLYGTAEGCGSASAGAVWKVSKKGKETVLHSFAGGSSDGANPYAGVILDSKGNLYGVTEEGGSSSVGTVYRLSKSRKLTVLRSFSFSDGEYPFGGLIRDAKGSLYGTGSQGGNVGYGTVWKLTP